MQILPLAKEYLTEEIIKKCEIVICSHCTRDGMHNAPKLCQILNYLTACEKYDLDKTVLIAVTDAASYLEHSKLKNSQEYDSLSEITRLVISTKRLKMFEDRYNKNRLQQLQSTYRDLF